MPYKASWGRVSVRAIDDNSGSISADKCTCANSDPPSEKSPVTLRWNDSSLNVINYREVSSRKNERKLLRGNGIAWIADTYENQRNRIKSVLLCQLSYAGWNFLWKFRPEATLKISFWLSLGQNEILGAEGPKSYILNSLKERKTSQLQSANYIKTGA